MRFAIIVRCSGRYSDAAIMRRERRRKSTESVEIVSFSNLQACTRGRVCVCVCVCRGSVAFTERERERERERIGAVNLRIRENKTRCGFACDDKSMGPTY
jgi:hypothetical protein